MECSLNDDRLTLAGLFFETHAGLAAELERLLAKECGIGVGAFEILLRLARSEDQRLRMSDLAAQVNLSPSGLTRSIDRLEQLGDVRREACPSDRRAAYAVLTEQGRKRVADAVPLHVQHLDSVFTGLLSEEQTAALEAALRIVRDALRPGAVAGT